uniref:Uncharacterized protein n=1 Tax=viral metagenome TaxID=1070528 RepID=A0A6M3JBF3_9ZZZZ
MEDKEFKNVLVSFFSETKKTGWGKNEIVTQIKELYIEFLESRLEFYLEEST